MKKYMFLITFLLASVELCAQWNWYNPQDVKEKEDNASFVHNQGWNEDESNYHRLPLRAKAKIRKDVWTLACQSAGLALRFRTSAEDIKVRYQVSRVYSMLHMPATGVSGVSLYQMSEKGRAEMCTGSYSFADTISYSFHVSRKETHPTSEYVLYLPLYNEVKWLEIGVKKGSELSFVPAVSDVKPIVVYGTSIAQGACASRPGMAWTNILNRSMGIPVVNLGFSGNGKLEKEVLDFVNEQDACVYILDCMPNLSGMAVESVKILVKNAVCQIREKHDTPILLVEHAGYSNAVTDRKAYENYAAPNKGQREAFEELKEEGIKNLFYLSHGELGFDSDSWVDYVHPSDWGMVQQEAAVRRTLKVILGK